MTDLRDFENELRTTLVEAERTARPDDGLAERLLAGLPPRRRPPHHVGPRRPRWLPPLLAAAATIALIAGGVVIVRAVQADKTVPPAHHTSAPPSSSPASKTPAAVVGPIGTPLPAGFTAADAQFADAQHGWAIGNVPCSKKPGYCATLARTTDGGRSWRSIPVPAGLTPVDDQGNPDGGSCGTNGDIYGPCVDRVLFADARHGYLWSRHALFATGDGGATWTNQRSAVLGLTVSRGNAILLSALHDCSTWCASRMFIAPVGSSNWHEVPVGPASGQLQGATWSLFGRGQAAYVYAMGADDAPVLYASVDGGRSWTLTQQDPCGATGPDPITAAPDGSVTMICGYAAAARAANPVQVSTDHGRTFGTRTAPRSGWLRSVALVAASADDLVAVVESEASTQPVVRSGDGGRTWHAATTVSGGPTIRAAFTDAHLGSIVTDGGHGVALTTDGGRTWTTYPIR